MTELLRSKIVPPRIHSCVVMRPRLVTRLNEGLAANLILVSAPAGFGKSTLIASWMAQLHKSVDCAWLSLDVGDSNPARFVAYLSAAMEKAVPCLSPTIRATFNHENLSTAVGSSSTGEQLASLLNGLATLDRRLVVVLDDYHVVEDCAVHRLLFALLTHLPTMVTIVLVTRSDPPLPLARLCTHGKLTSIRAADLRFSTVEAAEFLRSVMGLQLSEASAAALARRTEGWITGLQLAGLSLQQSEDVDVFISEFAGDDHNIRSYLVDEVLAGQPQGVRDFLLVTSILERLTAALCDGILLGDDGGLAAEASAATAPMSAQQILEYLEQHNLFIVRLDDHCQWYRYHTLFAELLRFHLWSERRDCLPLFHRRAAHWLAEHGFVDEAMRQALAAGDPALFDALKARSAQGDGHGLVGTWLHRFKQLTLAPFQHPVLPAAPPVNGHAFARGDYSRLDVFASPQDGAVSAMRAHSVWRSSQSPAEPLAEPLSEREQEVLGLLACGMSYQEIAQRLCISLPTVKTHVSHIYGKLGVHSRDEARERAVHYGILPR